MQLFHPPNPDPMLLEVTGYFLKPDLVESSLLRWTEVYCCVMCDFLRRCKLVFWLLKYVTLERGLLLDMQKFGCLTMLENSRLFSGGHVWWWSTEE